MTINFCDRCGESLTSPDVDYSKIGKYQIVLAYDVEKRDIENMFLATKIQAHRSLLFCADCARELEKFLDDEFSHMPPTVCAIVDEDGVKK